MSTLATKQAVGLQLRSVVDVLSGGQGTINVPSWSQASAKVAFVRYQYLTGDPRD
jgi:hypothetical protein